MNQVWVPCLLIAASLLSSCRTGRPAFQQLNPERMTELLRAYEAITIGMSKPEVVAIAGEPDSVFTPKNHTLNTREDYWHYTVTFADPTDGRTHTASVLQVVFPYLESQSPRAKVLAKWYHDAGRILKDEDKTYYSYKYKD